MNRGSLFDLMEQEAQPEPFLYSSKQPGIHTGNGTEKSANRNVRNSRHRSRHTRGDRHNRCRDRLSPHRRDHNRHTRSIRKQPGIWPSATTAAGKTADTARTRNMSSGPGGQQSSQPQYPPQPEIQDWQEERFMQEGRTANRTSPIRNTPHTVRRTTRNTSISRSPCWNPSIHLIRQFKTWHSKFKGMTRSFKFKKGTEYINPSGPGSEHLAGHGHELLFEHVPGPDDGYRSRNRSSGRT